MEILDFLKIVQEFGTYPIILYMVYQQNSIIPKKLDEIRLAVWRRTLTPQETLDTVAEKVWYASLDKIDFIRNILIANHIYDRRPQITENITTELIRRSNIYIAEFNELNTPIAWLWDVVGELFEFDPFLKEVLEVVFRPHQPMISIEDSNELKIKDITQIMIKYQDRMKVKLAKLIKNKCNNCLTK